MPLDITRNLPNTRIDVADVLGGFVAKVDVD